MTTTLHPRGVNHLALSTRDMKGQLEFWCDFLGCPLRALYYMHGVDGAFHGFVELAPESYIAFVQHPHPGDADQPFEIFGPIVTIALLTVNPTRSGWRMAPGIA